MDSAIPILPECLQPTYLSLAPYLANQLSESLWDSLPCLPILTLSVHPEKQYAVRALWSRDSGYLTKEGAPDELIAAIRKVANGGRYVSPSFAEKLASAFINGHMKPLHETLSDREYQVLCMIASGSRAKDVAKELSLSVKTVSTYRHRILKKMAMINDAELIRYAVQNQLVDYATNA